MFMLVRMWCMPIDNFKLVGNGGLSKVGILSIYYDSIYIGLYSFIRNKWQTAST